MTLLAGLHLTGAEGGTTFTDVAGHTFTRAGNVTTTTALFPPNGADSCATFDYSSNCYLTSTSSDYVLGSGDFYVRFWVRYPPLSSSNIPVCRFGGINLLQNTSYGLYSNIPLLGQYFTISIGVNAWRYVEVSRSGSTVYIFCDGTLVTSYTANSDSLTDNVVRVGGNYCKAYMGDFEFANVAGHTSNYTVPNAMFGENVLTVAGAATASFTSAATKAASFSLSGVATTFFPNTVSAFSISGEAAANFGQYNPRFVAGGSSIMSFASRWRFDAAMSSSGIATASFAPSYQAKFSGSSSLSAVGSSFKSGTVAISGKVSLGIKGQYQAPSRIVGVGRTKAVFSAAPHQAASLSVTGAGRLQAVGRAIYSSLLNIASSSTMTLRGTACIGAVASATPGAFVSFGGQAGKLATFAVTGSSSASFDSSYTMEILPPATPKDAESVVVFARQKVLYVTR